jgi:PadR family transcriptional regulator, regulatory protein PadR
MRVDQTRQSELLQGTLDAMVLRTLSRGSNHGYGVARAIEAASGGKLAIEEGSLYPALHRLERRGDLTSEWRITELKRRAKYYSLTPEGHRRLRAEVAQWEEVSGAVSRVLGLSPAGGAA